MSVTLFKLIVSSFRKNLPRNPIKTAGLQLRFSTAMEVAPVESSPKEPNDETIGNKSMTRYKRRFMKRQWDEWSTKKENGESAEKKVCERIKRKKVALLLGYCGVDYYGMQRNPGVQTIEEDLFKALLDAKYISEEDFVTQQNIQFQRSSRTDKGVSAARQVVSLKLPLEADIEEINKRLPECIRIFGLKRVTNRFNSKVKCNARTYSYTLPTYVFEPSLVTDEERRGYRIPADKLEKVNNVLSVYKGTKCYHNFTEKKHYTDPSASRYMMGFSVEKVFIDSDMEFAVLLVKGQSFMLHQIRKMVGTMIAVIRGHADAGVMERVFGKDKVMIPTAPGLGLVLDMVHYDRYDAKFKESHESLKWEAVEDIVQKFKHEYIYPNIVKGEIENNSMGRWLEKLSQHSYEPSDDVTDEKRTDDAGKEMDDDDDDCEDKDEQNETEADVKQTETEVKETVTEVKETETEVKETETEVKDTDVADKKEVV